MENVKYDSLDMVVCWLYGKDGIGRIILDGQERKRHEWGNKRSSVGKKGGFYVGE